MEPWAITSRVSRVSPAPASASRALCSAVRETLPSPPALMVWTPPPSSARSCSRFTLSDRFAPALMVWMAVSSSSALVWPRAICRLEKVNWSMPPPL